MLENSEKSLIMVFFSNWASAPTLADTLDMDFSVGWNLKDSPTLTLLLISVNISLMRLCVFS